MAAGFAAHFVVPLDDEHSCPICQGALKEPLLTKCGHHYCSECLKPLIRDGRFSCPVCRTELNESDTFLNNFWKRTILSLKIRCDQHEVGCEWIGELRQQDEHNMECGYVEQACPNDCGEKLKRKDMDKHKIHTCHRRIVNCCYCNEPLESGALIGHYETCDKYPVQCTYQCGVTVARREMDVHTSIEGKCPKSPLNCEFQHAGCQFVGIRKNLEGHVRDNTVGHLSLMMRSLHDTTERLETAERKQVNTEEMLLEVQKNLMTAEARLTKYEPLLEWNFESAEFLKVFLAGNTERSLLLSGSFVYVWKISNWSEKLRVAKEEEEEKFESTSSFNPGHHGYCFSLRAYLNGLNNYRGTHLSLGIYQHEVTDSKKPSFSRHGKMLLSIINKHPLSITVERNPSVQSQRTGWLVLVRDFISLEELQCLLVNDEIFFKFEFNLP